MEQQRPVLPLILDINTVDNTSQVPTSQMGKVGVRVPDPRVGKIKAKTEEADAGGNGTSGCSLKQILFGLVHFILFLQYEISSFIWLVAFSMCVANIIPTPIIEMFNLTDPVRKMLMCIIFNVFFVVYVQVPGEKRFYSKEPVRQYMKTFGSAPLGIFLVSAMKVFLLGMCASSLIVLYEFKMCNELDSYLLVTKYGNELGVSIVFNPALLALYISLTYPIASYIITYLWLKPSYHKDLLSTLSDFIGKIIFPSFCADIPLDAQNYFFALVFEVAEFIGAVLIPTYVFTLWHQSNGVVATVPPAASEVTEDSTSFHNFQRSINAYYTGTCIVMALVASLLLTVENKIDGLAKDLRKGVQARLLITMLITAVSFIHVLKIYYLHTTTEQKDQICLPNSHSSIYSSTTVNYVVLSGFCFYGAFKCLFILCNEMDLRTKVGRQRGQGLVVLNGTKINVKPVPVNKSVGYSLQEKKSGNEPQISDFDFIHHV